MLDSQGMHLLKTIGVTITHSFVAHGSRSLRSSHKAGLMLQTSEVAVTICSYINIYIYNFIYIYI